MGCRLGCQFGMGQEAKAVQPIVDADKDDSVLRQLHTIVFRLRRRSVGIASTVDPDHHGQGITAGFGGSPYIEVEAVFFHAVVKRVQRSEPIALNAPRTPYLRGAGAS